MNAAIPEHAIHIPAADQFKYLTSVMINRDKGITNKIYNIMGNKHNNAKYNTIFL